MKLLHLAVDNLLYLLNQKFTLQELLHLRGLCRPLCDLIESPYCIGRRKTLKLFWSFDDVCRYPGQLFRYGLENVEELRLKSIGRDDDDLIVWRVDCFGREAREMLIRLMPNVSHLVVYFGRSLQDDYEFVLEVLKCWLARTPLTGVSLFGLFESDDFSLRQHFSAQLVDIINSQWARLVALDICVENLFRDRYRDLWNTGITSTFHPDLFHRLSRLNFANTNAHDLMIVFNIPTVWSPRSTPALTTTTTTPASSCLTQLGFDYTFEMDQTKFYTDDILRTLAACDGLTHLRLAGDFVYFSNQLVKHIPRIESLELGQKSYIIPLEYTLKPQLNQLVHLTQLTLNYYDFSLYEREQAEQEAGRERFPVLARIAKLKLVHSHFGTNRKLYRLKCPDTFFSAIGRIFPNISQLTLRLGYVFHDDTKRTLPINPSVHLRHFRLLVRFRYIVCSTGTCHHLLSGHHQLRYRREMTDKWETMSHIQLGYNGVQLWVKSGAGGDTWREVHPAECVPQ